MSCLMVFQEAAQLTNNTNKKKKHISVARVLHANFTALKFRGDLYGETSEPSHRLLADREGFILEE